MELYQLQSFLAVVRNGSLSRAAASRHISLPGISKHIKMLEEAFGFPLFFRTPRGMELTEEGQRILKHVERIQNEVNELNALARKPPPIRIGLNIAPDFLELYQLQQLLVRHHPESEITLTNHNSGILLSRLQKDELDLCLAFGPVPQQLHKLPICQVAMVLMVPMNLGDAPIDLNEQCWIVNTDDCPFKEPLEEFWRSRGIVARATILAQDLSRKELVAQGLGIGFLEPQDGLSLISKGSGRRYGTYTLEVPLSIVYRDTTFHADAELLRQYIQNRYDTLPAVPIHIPTTIELQN